MKNRNVRSLSQPNAKCNGTIHLRECKNIRRARALIERTHPMNSFQISSVNKKSPKCQIDFFSDAQMQASAKSATKCIGSIDEYNFSAFSIHILR